MEILHDRLIREDRFFLESHPYQTPISPIRDNVVVSKLVEQTSLKK